MCDPRTAGHQVGPTTTMAQPTSGLSWFSSAPLNRWILLNGASWSAKTLWAIMSLPHAHPLCGSLPARAGASPALSPVSGQEHNIYFPLQVPSAPSHMVAQIRPKEQAGRGAMCTRWTCGSGSLGGASLAFWGLLVADTEARQTELQPETDSHGRAVEKRKHSTVQEGAKWLSIEESRVCKYKPCLSHTYLITTKINKGYL